MLVFATGTFILTVLRVVSKKKLVTQSREKTRGAASQKTDPPLLEDRGSSILLGNRREGQNPPQRKLAGVAWLDRLDFLPGCRP